MTLSTLPLSYCTNVHPGQSVEEVVNGISEYTAGVRRQIDRPMAAGLWLARDVVTELHQSEAQLERLAQTLWQHDLSCYTLNAFPYGNFHSDRVKEQVYLPDWASKDRVQYTKDCAKLLAAMLPEGAEGSISTVPLGGRMNPTGPEFHATCLHHLVQMGRFLKDLHRETGRCIRLAVEPEPMCEMSSIPDDTVPLFRTLFEMADALSCEDTVREYIGLCFDVCHQAVLFEQIPRSIDQVIDAGIRINKVHITNAVELIRPAENAAGREVLQTFVEPRYLHQTYAKTSSGKILSRTDLLTEDIQKSPADEFLQAEAWRVHFHVPVYADELGPLRTTRADLQAALRRVAMMEYAPHLEVETYTWPVMPDATEQKGLVDQISQEITAAYDMMAHASGQ
ncbi:MAG: metabolite traffic protein EboE [Fuerstiella sp.]